ncbi:hypothetical protein ACFSGI_09085 [Paenibacillus nicotianae]|uniref:Fur-regulated basic protein B n=1 Tax=Paenibacillus nicotianae TaxID=1526551 RepID=A0ABW4USW1_9BACL
MNFLKRIIHGEKKIKRLEKAVTDYTSVAKLLKNREDKMLDPKSNGLGKKGENPYER